MKCIFCGREDQGDTRNLHECPGVGGRVVLFGMWDDDHVSLLFSKALDPADFDYAPVEVAQPDHVVGE